MTVPRRCQEAMMVVNREKGGSFKEGRGEGGGQEGSEVSEDHHTL
jgi:hypothetical protein